MGISTTDVKKEEKLKTKLHPLVQNPNKARKKFNHTIRITKVTTY
jgi:hypothetical protein